MCSGLAPLALTKVQRLHLLPLRVALKDEGAERRLSLLVVPIAPVPGLHHKSHQPGVLLVGRKLADVTELELEAEEEDSG